MEQMNLVIEDMSEALTELVRALGGAKKVGITLWPEKSVEAAHKVLLDCLNPSQAARLNPDQVFLLFRMARQAGVHHVKRWFDESTGYLPSEPLEPEDERAKLQRAFMDSVALQAKIVDRMERLNVAPSLRAVAK